MTFAVYGFIDADGPIVGPIGERYDPTFTITELLGDTMTTELKGNVRSEIKAINPTGSKVGFQVRVQVGRNDPTVDEIISGGTTAENSIAAHELAREELTNLLTSQPQTSLDDAVPPSER